MRPKTKAALLTLAVVVLDQLSKLLVVENIARYEQIKVIPGLKLTNIRNDGIAFGLSGGRQGLVIVFTAVVLVVLLYYFIRQPERRFMWIAVGLLCGGAIGNVIDRVRFGSVIDFIKLSHWPVFNFADIAVSLGVLTLALILIRNE